MIHGYHLLTSWRETSLSELTRKGLSVDAGRGGISLLQHPRATLVERPYRHGGLRRLFLPMLFMKSDRPAQELQFHQKAFEAGVSTVEPVGWREDTSIIPLFRRYFYYSVFLPQAQTLPQALRMGQSPRPIIQQMAKTLRQLFDQRIYHHDLNLNNWLISNQQVYLIDFDRARQVDWDPQTFLKTALGRIARSGKKLGFLSFKTAFFRLAITSCKYFGLKARQMIHQLPESLAHISQWDKIRWRLSGGHQQTA